MNAKQIILLFIFWTFILNIPNNVPGHEISNIYPPYFIQHDMQNHKKINTITKYITQNYNVNPVVAKKISKSLIIEAENFNIKPGILLSIIESESSFNHLAISKNGCRGLMQINLPVWEDELNINKDNILNISTNIYCGTKILQSYMEQTNNINKALFLYSGKDKKYNSKIAANIDKYLIFKRKYCRRPYS